MRGREKWGDGDNHAEAEAAPPALHPAKHAAYFISLRLGWATHRAAPRAWVLLPWCSSQTPLEIVALLGQGGHRAWALGFGGLGGAENGLWDGQRPVRAWQAAPPLRALGETTASGGGCWMQDAGAAANGGTGRRAGAMATANGGQGRGPAAAAGCLAISQVQGLQVWGWGWGGDPRERGLPED